MSVGVDHTVSLARLDHRRTDSIFDAVQRRVELALGKDGSVIGRDQAVNLDHGGVTNGGYCVVKDLVSWHVVFGFKKGAGLSFVWSVACVEQAVFCWQRQFIVFHRLVEPTF